MKRMVEIVKVTAAVSGLAALPTSPIVAVVAVPAGALAALLCGFPMVVLAERRRWQSAWHAAALGAVAAAGAGALLVGLMEIAGVRGGRGWDRHTLALAWQFAAIAAPFGAASGLVYWARNIKVLEERRSLTFGALASLAAAIVFALNHEIH